MQYPFCDVDGALQGSPLTCITVSCTPGEFATCRGDIAITCNTAGNDYDLISCALGCDPASGCRACSTNDQCANPSPICDGSTCRACITDDECPSKVCDRGSCMAEAGIVYAAPNGSSSASCSLNDPCSLLRAQMVVTSVAVPPVLRMLPGVYSTGISIGTATTSPVVIVAAGATIGGQNGVQALDGAKVDIRGVTTNTTDKGLYCASSTNARSALTVRDAVVMAGSDFAILASAGYCTLAVYTTDFQLGSTNASLISLSSNAAFSGDRVHTRGASPSGILAFGSRIDINLTNSLLENASFNWVTTDTGIPGSSVTVAFSTIILPSAGTLFCETNSGSPYRTTVYENNIVVGKNTASSVSGTDCTLWHDILFPFTGTPGTNVVADPQFVDPGSGNYRVKTTSPAIDAAVPMKALASADLDGTPRPQGAQPDIGAFELKP